tara:strand:+ start:6397 stop:9645 length:3249 start_codon:yes stop_codon:yes gene_type:complete
MVFFPLKSYSAVNVSELQQTECGLDESGRIEPGDGTLCEQDIAFGMMYELFPSIFNELIPFWDLSMYSDLGETPNTPELLGEYRGDIVFFSLFDLFFKLVVLCIVVYAGILVLSTLLKWLKGEKIVQAISPKDSPKTWALGAFLGGGFLIPYKQFFIGQLIVFSFAITSLSLVNFTFSLILAGNQDMYRATLSSVSPDKKDPEVKRNRVQNRHDFLADSYYRNLTRMQLCRKQSSEYIMSHSGSRFDTPNKYKKASHCALPALQANEDIPDTRPAFVHFKTDLASSGNGGNVFFSGNTSIDFSVNTSSTAYCATEGEALPSYDCGSMSVIVPDWSRSPLVRLFGDESGELIRSVTEGLRDSLDPGMSPSSVKLTVSSGWESFRQRLLEKLEDAYNENKTQNDLEELIAVQNEVTTKKAVLAEAMMDSARPHLRQASTFYHQMAMNVLMFGSSERYRVEDPLSVSSSPQDFYGNDDWSGLFYHLNKAGELSALVAQIQCMDYRHDLHKSELTASFLRGERADLPKGALARCLDIESGSVVEYDANYNSKTPEELREEALARFEELRVNFENIWEKEVGTLSGQRKGIEESFFESVRDVDENEWWINLRQKGYLAAADYAQSMNSRVTGVKRSLVQIVNNFSVSIPNYDSRYISDSIKLSYDKPESYDAKDAFGSFRYAGEDLFKTTRLPPATKDPLLANSAWVVEQEHIMRESPLAVDTTTFLSDVSNIMTLSTTYLSRLGIGMSEDAKDPEKCIDDPNYCPFPMSDPIVEISLMGHDMVDAGLWFFASAIPIKVLAGEGVEKLRADRQVGKASVGKATWFDKIKDSNVVLGKLTSLLPKGVLGASALLDILFDTLSTIMAMFLALGLVLAYLLPLVPKIYLYFTFAAWLMVVVMASFSVLLWSFFWIRLKEKRELLKTAAFHYGVEILFKPTFSLISVVFAWYFFFVVAFVVGGSTSWLFRLPSDGIVSMGLHTVFILLMIMFTYLIGLRYAYQLMGDMTSVLLTKLGVNDSKQNDKISELVKVLLYEHARGLVGKGMGHLDKNMGRDAAKASMMQRAKEARELTALYNRGKQRQQQGAKNE